MIDDAICELGGGIFAAAHAMHVTTDANNAGALRRRKAAKDRKKAEDARTTQNSNDLQAELANVEEQKQLNDYMKKHIQKILKILKTLSADGQQVVHEDIMNSLYKVAYAYGSIVCRTKNEQYYLETNYTYQPLPDPKWLNSDNKVKDDKLEEFKVSLNTLTIDAKRPQHGDKNAANNVTQNIKEEIRNWIRLNNHIKKIRDILKKSPKDLTDDAVIINSLYKVAYVYGKISCLTKNADYATLPDPKWLNSDNKVKDDKLGEFSGRLTELREEAKSRFDGVRKPENVLLRDRNNNRLFQEPQDSAEKQSQKAELLKQLNDEIGGTVVEINSTPNDEGRAIREINYDEIRYLHENLELMDVKLPPLPSLEDSYLWPRQNSTNNYGTFSAALKTIKESITRSLVQSK